MPEEVLESRDAIRTIDWLEEFLDPAWLTQRLAKRHEKTLTYGQWLPPRISPNVLLDLFAAYREDLRLQGTRAFVASVPVKQLVTEASNIKHVANLLVDRDRHRLALLLQQPRKVEGYLYQCRIAAHYVRGGGRLKRFSVGGTDEGDLIIGAAGGDVEVQCKALQPGTGRRIRPVELGELSAKVLNNIFKDGCLCVIRVECQGRLEPHDVPVLAGDIEALLASGEAKADVLNRYSVIVEQRSGVIPFDEVNVLRQRDPMRPLQPPHLAILGQEGVDGVQAVLIVRSQKNDYLVGKMLDRANQGANQVKSGLPGVVFVHVPGEVDWSMVQSTPGFERQVSHGFRYFGATCIAALVFTSDPIAAFVFPNRGVLRALPSGFKVTGPFSES
ncbi:MAG TPA: hypothetical protein VEW47_10055 [Candidatus Dormibacteraeota bacterium]|nr:hypothetical protein [Candidatus Dormibacteraeota bacterium]